VAEAGRPGIASSISTNATNSLGASSAAGDHFVGVVAADMSRLLSAGKLNGVFM
jgi:hypothetical protein